MKRRNFVKAVSAGTLGATILPAYAAKKEEDTLSFNEYPINKAREIYQENPIIVEDKNGTKWMFALERLAYPNNEELISVYKYENNKWEEQAPLAGVRGEFEKLTATCNAEGEPIVAWVEIQNGDWVIVASTAKNNIFSKPQTVGEFSDKNINPVLCSDQNESVWLAWESYKNGKFSVCLRQMENGIWGDVIQATAPEKNCYEPAIAEGVDGNLYLAYSFVDGVHRNIELKILDTKYNSFLPAVPVAIGGTFIHRVNQNTNPALAFDKENRLWISWENNHEFSRREDSDCFSGSRSCPVVCYVNGSLTEVQEPGMGKWMFKGHNDHLPTFIRDSKGDLFLFTIAGGVFGNNNVWKCRMSQLDLGQGWAAPVVVYTTQQKGVEERPAALIESNGICQMVYRKEKYQKHPTDDGFNIRKSELNTFQFKLPKRNSYSNSFIFSSTQVEENCVRNGFEPVKSGRPAVLRRTMVHQGETFTLLMGNLHEHTDISKCWPAGTDGTIDSNYRYGKDSEGYDFMALTDHDDDFNEPFWRRNIRMAEFYNCPEHFIALQGVEYALSSESKLNGVQPGVGHRNLIFDAPEEAWKYIRDEYGVFSARTPETNRSDKLWKLLHEKEIKAVSIPHHCADDRHPMSWDFHDPEYETVVEVYQCRGNAEYPGCPSEKPLARHNPTIYKEAYIDHALREKKYKFGFIASGDHNAMGIGLSCLWVREVSRAGILEAIRERRTYATTGDKIFVDFRLNGCIGGETCTNSKNIDIILSIEAIKPIRVIDILKDSKVVKSITPKGRLTNFSELITDLHESNGDNKGYYYVRITQDNEQLAWSSPIWVE